ncbi:MAG: hypothetical protein PGMFKBFP_03205 [Anaerolineales bacterium]|nr:hypothetical protein [Anaerolineales bacterium]
MTVTTTSMDAMNRSVKKLTETLAGASLNEYRLVAAPTRAISATISVESKSIWKANSPKGWMANSVRLGGIPSVSARIAARSALKEPISPKKAATPREVRGEAKREASAPTR